MRYDWQLADWFHFQASELTQLLCFLVTFKEQVASTKPPSLSLCSKIGLSFPVVSFKVVVFVVVDSFVVYRAAIKAVLQG